MKKRVTTASNLTFIALMCSINVIFAVLMIFVPALSLIIYLFLPLVTTLVIILCRKQYLPIYYLTSIILSFVVNINGIEYIIFTLVPSLINGTIFGYCLLKKCDFGITILFAAFCQFLFSLITIPLINLIYTNNQNIIDVFKVFIGHEREHLTYKLFLPITYIVALTQNIISFLIISSEINKFDLALNSESKHYIAYSYLSLFLLILQGISLFFFTDLMYLILIFNLTLCFSSLGTSNHFNSFKFKVLLIILCIFVFVGFVIFSQLNIKNYSPLLLLILTSYVALYDLCVYFFKKEKTMVKYNKE